MTAAPTNRTRRNGEEWTADQPHVGRRRADDVVRQQAGSRVRRDTIEDTFGLLMTEIILNIVVSCYIIIQNLMLELFMDGIQNFESM